MNDITSILTCRSISKGYEMLQSIFRMSEEDKELTLNRICESIDKYIIPTDIAVFAIVVLMCNENKRIVTERFLKILENENIAYHTLTDIIKEMSNYIPAEDYPLVISMFTSSIKHDELISMGITSTIFEIMKTYGINEELLKWLKTSVAPEIELTALIKYPHLIQEKVCIFNNVVDLTAVENFLLNNHDPVVKEIVAAIVRYTVMDGTRCTHSLTFRTFVKAVCRHRPDLISYLKQFREELWDGTTSLNGLARFVFAPESLNRITPGIVDSFVNECKEEFDNAIIEHVPAALIETTFKTSKGVVLGYLLPSPAIKSFDAGDIVTCLKACLSSNKNSINLIKDNEIPEGIVSNLTNKEIAVFGEKIAEDKYYVVNVSLHENDIRYLCQRLMINLIKQADPYISSAIKKIQENFNITFPSSE